MATNILSVKEAIRRIKWRDELIVFVKNSLKLEQEDEGSDIDIFLVAKYLNAQVMGNVVVQLSASIDEDVNFHINSRISICETYRKDSVNIHLAVNTIEELLDARLDLSFLLSYTYSMSASEKVAGHIAFRTVPFHCIVRSAYRDLMSSYALLASGNYMVRECIFASSSFIIQHNEVKLKSEDERLRALSKLSKRRNFWAAAEKNIPPDIGVQIISFVK